MAATTFEPIAPSLFTDLYMDQRHAILIYSAFPMAASPDPFLCAKSHHYLKVIIRRTGTAKVDLCAVIEDIRFLTSSGALRGAGILTVMVLRMKGSEPVEDRLWLTERLESEGDLGIQTRSVRLRGSCAMQCFLLREGYADLGGDLWRGVGAVLRQWRKWRRIKRGRGMKREQRCDARSDARDAGARQRQR